MANSKSPYSSITGANEADRQSFTLQVQPEASEDELLFLQLLDPSGQTDFWDDVTTLFNTKLAKSQTTSYEKAIDEVRADRITKHCEGLGKDPVVTMMSEWYDIYERNTSCSQLFPGFEKQISKIAEIILNREYKRVEEHNNSVDLEDVIYCDYSEKEFKIPNHPAGKRTVLQLAAEGFRPRDIVKNENKESSSKQFLPRVLLRSDNNHDSYKRNFTNIARCILRNDPEAWGMGDETPLELALKYHDDEMSALLINAMKIKSRIRILFETHGAFGPKARFQDIIRDESMKKTVIAVLDATVNKDWPYQPAEERDGDDKVHVITDDPLRYHFHYQILDGDMDGRPARKEVETERTPGDEITRRKKTVVNEDFDVRSISCLQALCQSSHKKAINHPTVRSLARRKWERYGKFRIRLYAFSYTVFLAILSCALLLAVTSQNPRRYTSPVDKFRGFCEVSSLLVACFYLVLEVDQLNKEGLRMYLSDVFNWFDIGGIIGILILVPLRFTDSQLQWIFATITYVLNFLRIYKYFPAWKSIGIYSKTLSILIKKDVVVFGVAYFFVLITFCGATFLSLRGVIDYHSPDGFIEIRGFADVLLRGIKALAQLEGFDDKYKGYDIFSLIVILTSMFVIMVFLVNILIAQLSASYEKACLEATEQYDMDKALFVARLDDSRFRWRNLRINHYEGGSYEYDKATIQELMSKWDMLHSEQ